MPQKIGASEQEPNKSATKEMADNVVTNNGSSSPNHSTQTSSDFTSEIFKIEIQNLPRFYGIGQMKKLLNQKLKLNSCKLKPVGKTFMFACFR